MAPFAFEPSEQIVQKVKTKGVKQWLPSNRTQTNFYKPLYGHINQLPINILIISS